MLARVDDEVTALANRSPSCRSAWSSGPCSYGPPAGLISRTAFAPAGNRAAFRIFGKYRILKRRCCHHAVRTLTPPCPESSALIATYARRRCSAICAGDHLSPCLGRFQSLGRTRSAVAMKAARAPVWAATSASRRVVLSVSVAIVGVYAKSSNRYGKLTSFWTVAFALAAAPASLMTCAIVPRPPPSDTVTMSWNRTLGRAGASNA